MWDHNKTMKVTLFIPVKNEIEGVKAIMPQVKKEWVDEILFVDGNSTDGTKEYLEEKGYKVIVQKKPGLYAAWWEGFDAATGDIIIPFSPDNNSVPEIIPLLVEKMKEGYDMVIASRYAKGAKSHDDSLLTSFGNKLFTGMINLLFGGNYTDALVMYRAFRKDLLSKLNMREAEGGMFEITLAIRCAKYGFKTTEVPADEPARIGSDDSRAWPGLTGRIRGGLLILKRIAKEFFSRKRLAIP